MTVFQGEHLVILRNNWKIETERITVLCW